MTDLKPWPLFGYAPGGYFVHCLKCSKEARHADKRATICLECAAVEAKSRIVSLETELQALKVYAGEKSNQYVAAMEENKALRKALEPFADRAKRLTKSPASIFAMTTSSFGKMETGVAT
jgi:hypothetical protein